LISHLGFAMNGSLFSLRSVVIAALMFLLLGVLATPTFAAAPTETNSQVCFAATFLQEIAGDRSKIVQLSIVFVMIGIALLFKK